MVDLPADHCQPRGRGLQPGNLEWVETFPDFCLLQHPSPVHFFYTSAASTNGSSRPGSALSRSATFSSVSTDRSSVEPPSPVSVHTKRPAQRTRQFKKALLQAAQLERPETKGPPLELETKSNYFKAQRLIQYSDKPADTAAAVGPVHEQGLVKMTFAEQQRWVTVQQKTFTKWYAP